MTKRCLAVLAIVVLAACGRTELAEPLLAPSLRGEVPATFEGGRAHLDLPGGEVMLVASTLGRGESLRVLDDGAPAEAVGGEVHAARAPGVVEWWRSLAVGLEHGVTIDERTEGEGALRLEIEVRGAHLRTVSEDAIAFEQHGRASATYAHLVVLDADGSDVPAHMRADGARIVIEVDDTAARYPLVVDPLVSSEEATLSASDGANNDIFGHAVAISADATRAVASVREDDTAGGTDAGSVRVFVRTGTTWAAEATLLASGGAMGDRFGHSVAISADGSRVLVGAIYDDTVAGFDAGSARVFLRSGTAWAEEATLLAPDGQAFDYFGTGVALSADGTRAFVGVNGDDTTGGTDAGSARVFLRTGVAWTPEATLLPPDGAASDGLGASIAATSDGSRVVVGAPDDDAGGSANAGTARVFSRSGTVWSHEASLAAPDAGVNDALGWSVAIAADGSRVLAGARNDDVGAQNDAGTARVFSRSGVLWTPEATLTAPDGLALDNFGTSVALSTDATFALVGASGDDILLNQGTARFFVRAGTAWTQELTLTHTGALAGDGLGSSVSLTADGTRAIVGVPYDGVSPNENGSARIFSIRATTGTPCGSDAICQTGFCTDGVCCNARCGGGTSDCQACESDLTGVADGTCAALQTAVAAATTCRPSVSTCDVAEVCSSSSMVCPADAFAGNTVVCRASTDLCDAVERCTGTSSVCPADALVSSGTECRPASDVCDIAETCTGSSAACPTNGFAANTTVCRSVAGTCDVAESCTGMSAACPTDGFRAGGVTCRADTGGGCDIAEVCSGSAAACPGDTFAGAGSVCRAAADTCDVAEACTGTSAACPVNALQPSTFVCRAATTECDLAETCTGSSAACPGDAYAPASTTCGPAVSGLCDAPDHCSGSSTACVATYLSGTECRASAGPCDVAETCPGGTTTCPTDGFRTAGLTCRAEAGICDIEEVCTGTSPACPTNAMHPSTVTCRPAASGCDLPESCTGIAAFCPADLFAPATTTCGAAPSGPCDAADHCSGTDAACIATFLAGVECRPAAGACDLPESCTGAVTTCPPDVLVSAGITCGGTGAGSCSSPGTCNGTAPACPGATPFPSGTVCLPAAAGDPCDLDDTCDGTSDACQPRFATAGTVCDTTVADVCDAPDVCAGTSADCVPTFLSGVECRSSVGICDSPELCSGTAAACPTDLFESAGMVCRASSDPVCDPAETCDGATGACPTDVDTCGADAGALDGGSMPDAGATDSGTPTDSGGRSDTGVGTDAPTSADGGAPPPAPAGCQCHLGRREPSLGALGVLALSAAVWSRRRAR